MTVYFTDRDLGKRFPEVLTAGGLTVHRHADAAVKEFNVRLIVVIGNAPFPVLAKHFVDTIPRIEDFLAATKPPFIAKVYRPNPGDLAKNPNAAGRIESWYPKDNG